jgi:hypothetical protein
MCPLFNSKRMNSLIKPRRNGSDSQGTANWIGSGNEKFRNWSRTKPKSYRIREKLWITHRQRRSADLGQRGRIPASRKPRHQQRAGKTMRATPVARGRGFGVGGSAVSSRRRAARRRWRGGATGCWGRRDVLRTFPTPRFDGLVDWAWAAPRVVHGPLGTVFFNPVRPSAIKVLLKSLNFCPTSI